tara:strand:+ start:6052 stop:6324 length:273 start_codon:yes stop_codon:yes gene_type:complete
MKCSICKKDLGKKFKSKIHASLNSPEKKEIRIIGHNAMPVNDGRCCDKCNEEVVLVKRFELMGLGHPDDYTPVYIPEFPVSKIKKRDTDW